MKLRKPQENLLILAMTLTGLLFSAPGCGKKSNSLSEGLSMQVAPDTAIVVPGKSSSCNDLHEAKLNPTAGINQSVGPYRLYFPRFRFKWNGSESENAPTGAGTTLYIAAMRFTVNSPSINGGADFKYEFDTAEIEALFGQPGGKIDGSNNNFFQILSDQNSVGSSGTDNQNDRSFASYPTCGLAIGGIPIDEKETPNFKASGKITIIGYIVNADYTQRPVKIQAPAKLQYFK